MPKPPSSTRTSSSHKSSLEPRGVPEFDREYARQLSLARHGTLGGGSRTRADADSRSPNAERSRTPFPPELPKPSRLKEYVSAHFNPHGSMTTTSQNDKAAAATDGRARAVEPTASPLPRDTPERGNASVTSSCADTPANLSMTKSRLNLDVSDAASGGVDTDPREEWRRRMRAWGSLGGVVVAVWLAIFVSTCTLSVLVCDERGYNPDYFSGSGDSTREGEAAFTPSGVDSLLPQLNRQLGLRVRHGLRRVTASVAPLYVAWMITEDIGQGISTCLNALHRYFLAPIWHGIGSVLSVPGRLFVGSNASQNVSGPTSSPSGVRRVGTGLRSGAATVFESVLAPSLRSAWWAVTKPPRIVVGTTAKIMYSIGDGLRFIVSPRRFARIHHHGTGNDTATGKVASRLSAGPNHSATHAQQGAGATGGARKGATFNLWLFGVRVWEIFFGPLMWDTGAAPSSTPSPAATPANAPTAGNPSPATAPRDGQQLKDIHIAYEQPFPGDRWEAVMQSESVDLNKVLKSEFAAAVCSEEPSCNCSATIDDVTVSGTKLLVSFVVNSKTAVITTGDHPKSVDEQVKEATHFLQARIAEKMTSYPFEALGALYEHGSKAVEAAQAETLEKERRAAEEAKRQRMAERTAGDDANTTAPSAVKTEKETPPQNLSSTAAIDNATQPQKTAVADPCDCLAAFSATTSPLRATCTKQVELLCGTRPTAETDAKRQTAAHEEALAAMRANCERETTNATAVVKAQCEADLHTAVERLQAECDAQSSNSSDRHNATLTQCTEERDKLLVDIRTVHAELTSARDAQTNSLTELQEARRSADQASTDLEACRENSTHLRDAAACQEAADEASSLAEAQCGERISVAVSKSVADCETSASLHLQHSLEDAAQNYSQQAELAAQAIRSACEREKVTALTAANAVASEAAAVSSAALSESQSRLSHCEAESAAITARLGEEAQQGASKAEAALQAALLRLNDTAHTLARTREECHAQLALATEAAQERENSLRANLSAACDRQVQETKQSADKDREEALRGRGRQCEAEIAQRLSASAAKMSANLTAAKRQLKEACEVEKTATAAVFTHERTDLEARLCDARAESAGSKEEQASVNRALRGLLSELRGRCAHMCQTSPQSKDLCAASAIVADVPEGASTSLLLTRLHDAMLPADGGELAGYCGYGWQQKAQSVDAAAPMGQRAWWRSAVLVALGGLLTGSLAFTCVLHRRAKAAKAKNASFEEELRVPHTMASSRAGEAAGFCTREALGSATVSLAQALDGYYGVMEAWHLTCCSLLIEHDSPASARGQVSPQKRALTADRGRLLTPPSSDAASRNSSQTMPFDGEGTAGGRGDAVSGSHRSLAVAGAAAVSPDHIDDRALASTEETAGLFEMLHCTASAYFGTLESYYVDLLEAVTNRELVEQQLVEVEEVAAKQSSVLERQSSTVTKLQGSLDEERDSARRERAALETQCKDLRSLLEAKVAEAEAAKAGWQEQMALDRRELEKANGMAALQAEMVSVLEEQLKRLTPAAAGTSPHRSPIATTKDPAHDVSDISEQLRMLVQRESDVKDALRDDLVRGRQPRAATPGATLARRTPTADSLVRTSPTGGRSTMVRNRDTTRRYKQLDWQDVDSDDTADAAGEQ